MAVDDNRLLLINPYQTYLKSLESEYQSYIPYGLTCIAAIGVKAGFNTVILDCLDDETKTEFADKVRFGKTNEEIKQIIEDFRPDIVGISSTFSMFEPDATEIAALVKSIDKNIIVILGGVTATLPELYIRLLQQSEVYDIMSRGEGEATFSELLKNYDKKTKSIANLVFIKGIAFRKDNSIVQTEERPFITDLDSLPYPALNLLNLDKIFHNKYFSRWRNNPVGKRVMPVFTSRGCPYDCCFCSVHSQSGYHYRTFSTRYVLNFMKQCINDFGVAHFHFEDDNLTLDMDRAKEFFRKLKDLGISWDTPNGVRADKLDEEMIQLMVESGATSISIAAESGNEEVRINIINKNLKTESIIRAAELCDKYNLPCIVFFVVGFPGETMDNIKETVQFAKKLTERYNTINMIFLANPLPGTRLHELAVSSGYIKHQLTNYDYFTAIRANQSSIIQTEEFDKRKIFRLLTQELDNEMFSVHNISQPMFWINSVKANSRAKRVFPRITDAKVKWEWIGE
ncbi:TPA: B12-binding domain-containing radical SAM protein [Candidatus Scatousia excrementigallinarum]|uniref:B12-binding domain-containing radical SAM protein n=1 Tax=Candidatus Scatousia excrementigallinarum TaxID=2840935 RepID=A0A9D1F1W4_9BACT|nr:B12-binding domain-containing radical SAM protein [Candidatus Scatousia excrementigallinarum]